MKCVETKQFVDFVTFPSATATSGVSNSSEHCLQGEKKLKNWIKQNEAVTTVYSYNFLWFLIGTLQPVLMYTLVALYVMLPYSWKWLTISNWIVPCHYLHVNPIDTLSLLPRYTSFNFPKTFFLTANSDLMNCSHRTWRWQSAL